MTKILFDPFFSSIDNRRKSVDVMAFTKITKQIGKLLVMVKIATVSSDTIIFKGIFDGRLIAVRLMKDLEDVATHEKEILLNSDSHLNIVRMYGTKSDEDFIYLCP